MSYLNTSASPKVFGTKLIFGALFALFLTNSCSNDFDLVSKWKQIPVVYGFLDSEEPINYIRVEKAFLDPKTNALILAQNADSLYFGANEIVVRLYEVTGTAAFPSGFSLKETLTRVEASAEGFVPNPNDPFADFPRWLYKSTFRVIAGKKYALRVTKPDVGSTIGAVVCQSSAIVLANFTLNSNSIPNRKLWEPEPTQGSTTDFSNQQIRWEWTNTGTDAELFDVTLLATVETIFNDGTAPTRQVVRVKTISGATKEQSLNYLVKNMSVGTLVTTMGSALLDAAPNVSKRCVTNVDIEIAAGGADIRNYLDSERANSGLTGGFSPNNTYTNVTAGSGIARGVFSSRTKRIFTGFNLGRNGTNQLANTPSTSAKGFKSFGLGCGN